jgi:hypothetical protein
MLYEKSYPKKSEKKIPKNWPGVVNVYMNLN